MSMKVEFSSNFEQVKRQLSEALAQTVENGCIHLQNEVKKTLTGGRNGHKYRVPNTSQTYTASAPGEAPAVRTGDLRNSIKYELQRTQTEILGGVGSDLEKAIWLENGTSKMEARPFLLKTFERERMALKRILGGGSF
ncbi:hypothetical protein BAMA_15770 [Bacillus manliponensis]|uniref:HK97 gp10 family phage protein n=1 Tax=Bacillus manliponensis TaxID=574376 RepID=A0A073JQI5_9BACI|nr:HK97 gp10 family phage protein [Bacillus manliponensis]KEK17344.1 hypothetical protein BAMA_15770 [Bacillus manliponensis]